MKLFIFVLLALASIATAQTDINGIISSNGNLTYVTNLFAITGPIYGDNTTAFVALDSAFDQLPASVLNATTSVPNLARKILRYSAFNSALNFTSLNETNANLTIYNNTIFNTLKSLDNSSGPVYFTYRNGSTFFNNYILFERANGTQGSNGVVYTVNKLPLADFTLDDFVDLFNHSIFEEALDEAGLEDFAERRSRTIFSPSNAAFIAVTDFNATLPTSRPGDDDDDDLPYLRATLAKTPFTLRELLRYHISTRVYSFLNLTNDQLLPTNLTNKFIRVNIYNNDIFTVNGKVISNGGWIRDDDDNERDDEFDGPFEDSLERFNRRVGFFFVLNDVLFPPTQSAYQYIGNATNFSGNISEYTRNLLAQEAITVFWINSTTTSETDNLFILNGTYFAAGLLSGTYQTLNNSLNQSSILTVSNNGSAITFSTSSGLNFIVDSSILVTNGVIHVISTFVPEVSSSETGVISSVSGGISSAVDSASGGISSAIDSASGGITSAISSASGGISSAIDSASGGITSAVSSASGGISSAVDSASGGISSAVDSASAGISSVIGSASDIIESIFGKRVPAATSA